MPVYRRARLGLGYLAQEASIFRKLTVEENVLAILETLPLTKAQRADQAEELLASLSLTKVAKQRAYTLSGGERRKLEIARALVRKPAILMLDEPFSGVDTAGGARHSGDRQGPAQARAGNHRHGPQRARNALDRGPGLPRFRWPGSL
jgi:ABC-type multidrug transport system ATPase subunit